MNRIKLVKGDITTAPVDAIVNAANQGMLVGSGVCGAIYGAAGEEDLDDEVFDMAMQRGLPEVMCPTGEVVVTGAHALPARFIIHTAGPIYADYSPDEAADLIESCYARCIERADQLGCISIAFPAISTGIYGYPLVDAAIEAVGSVAAALTWHPRVETVAFYLFDDEAYEAFAEALAWVSALYDA
jgi:O-acetyl-ADP-ribose deacetylase (regulator of RNase III)